MNILVWIILGVVSGWLAGEIYQDSGFGLWGNLVVGILGSFIGGFVGDKLGIGGAQRTGLNFASIITAVLGALLLLFILSLF